jgi:abnormal spindle-like microcephaly-associated protein
MFVIRMERKLELQIMALKEIAVKNIQKQWIKFRKCLHENKAATKIQSLIRLKAAVGSFQGSRVLAMMMQRLARRRAGIACHERVCFLRLKCQVLAIQRIVRKLQFEKVAEKAIIICQKVVRGYCKKNKYLLCLRSICSFQAKFRAYKVRLVANKNRRIVAVRAKMFHAAMKAKEHPENQLGNRTKSALDMLSKAKKLGTVLAACKTLKLSTQLSPPCCVAFAAGGATRTILKYIKTCNRSAPHQEVLRATLLVLCNVAKHESTVHDMLHVSSSDSEGGVGEAVDVLVEMITMFKDIEAIFKQAVYLLECFSKDAEFRLTWSSNTEIKKRLVATATALEKKHSPNSGAADASSKSLSNRVKTDTSKSTMLETVLKLKTLLSTA